MRQKQVTIIMLSLLLVAGLIAVFFYTTSKRAPNAILGGVELFLKVADTEDLRAQGLSGSKPLFLNEGMLFVFPQEGLYGFWMKDMLFSIDILWLDSSYRIVDVKENATPGSYPESFVSSVKARYVLELSAGFFEAHKLKKGDRVEFLK